MLNLLLSALAGMLSTLSPCVLPLVPILLTSALQASRWGPAALLGGLVLSYTLVGSALAAFGSAWGLEAGALRGVAAALMLLLGLTLLLPALQQGLTRVLSPLTHGANARLQSLQADTAWGQGLLGLLLGVVWSPCVGPTLGAAVTLAAKSHSAGAAGLTLLAFGVGAAAPMAPLAYGSRAALGARRQRLLSLGQRGRQLMGGALIGVAVLVFSGMDHTVEAWLTAHLPVGLIEWSTRY